MPPSSLALPISTSRPQWAQTWSRAGILMRPRPQFPDLLINQLRRMERVSCSAHVGGENSKSVERLSASKRNSPFIFLRHNWRSAKLPVDLQVRIIPCQRAFRCGVVIVAGFVEDVSIFRNHDKTVRESRRDPQHALVFTAKRLSEPSAKGWRATPQIHRNIEDLA